MTGIHKNNVTSRFSANLSIAKKSKEACFSSQSVEWNTPAHIVQSVLSVLKVIDLDPCSNSHTRPNIPANTLYTKNENGLNKQWSGRVYMNPPYGREIINWVRRLHIEYKSNHVREAVALLPARTDTVWFRILRDYPRCFIHGRLKFGNASTSAPFPSVVVYLGLQSERFNRVFSKLGDVYVLLN